MDEYPITPEDWADIFAIIKADRTIGLFPEAPPRFYLHAGQPGCGKTEVNNLVKAQLDGNILECNADNLRDYHPDVDKILREREAEYPNLTWTAANRWNKALIDEGISHRYHLLIETTLHDQELALVTFARMKQHGYTTNLQVLAVPYRWSWLGIHLRYEALKSRKGFARRVSEADHDLRYNQLPGSLRAIIDSPDLDHVVIYRRMLKIGAGAHTAIELVTDQKADALGAFHQVIGQKMDDAESALFQSECARVIEYMTNRSASVEEMQAFSRKAHRLASE